MAIRRNKCIRARLLCVRAKVFLDDDKSKVHKMFPILDVDVRLCPALNARRIRVSRSNGNYWLGKRLLESAGRQSGIRSVRSSSGGALLVKNWGMLEPVSIWFHLILNLE